MRVAILLLAVIAVAFAYESDLEVVFQNWRIQHHKFYASANEYQKRFTIFAENVKRIEQFNAEKHSFTVGLNSFADLRNEEFRALYLMNEMPEDNSVSNVFTTKIQAPDSWDWREHGAVNAVKDQGQCGSCYAFGAVAAMEGAWFNAGHKLASFSEQEILDCSYSLFGNHGCNGGLHNKAIEYVIKNKGIDSEESYPYTASYQKVCKYNVSAKAGEIKSVQQVKNDENALKEAASQHVVTIAIDASQWSFQMYKNGIYDESKCSSTRLDHAVAIVGYGRSTADYWIVRNSWASSWGDNGYILMSRNKNNQCGVATKAYVATA